MLKTSKVSLGKSVLVIYPIFDRGKVIFFKTTKEQIFDQNLERSLQLIE